MCNRMQSGAPLAKGDHVITTLTLGVFTPSVLLTVAERTGRLAAAGLAVRPQPVTSSPAQFLALLDGALDAVLTSPDNVLAYRFDQSNPLGRLADIRIVGAVDRGLGLALYAQPGRADPALLRGAVFGVDVPNSGFALAMYALAESLGLDRGEFRVIALGATPRRVDALLSGRCAATILGVGNELRAEQAGCVPLARVAEVCAPYLGSVLAVAGGRTLPLAQRLMIALRETARDISLGLLDQLVRDTAAEILAIPGDLAARHLDRLRSETEGLITTDEFDHRALATVIELRCRYLPTAAGLAHALHPESGLLAIPGS